MVSLQGKCLMVQGVASGVGKSLLAAALCRILVQDGLRVAPFKAWNMALNSYITADGREIGWAQGIQAEAAGILATGHMNPFLLKPCGRGRTQIIISGKPEQGGYSEDIEGLLPDGPWPVITQSLDHLRQRYDVIIIEGAGSPAEINLKDRDLANMGVARLAGAPVLLIADIDQGGALAALVGTCELLDTVENQHIAGFVINKFRGDFDILVPGLEAIEAMTGKPILGVIPYVPGLSLGEEDSMGLPEMSTARTAQPLLQPDQRSDLLDAEERDEHLDRWAAAVRASLDMDQIYQLLERGI
ncbi:MAG: cobyric acid synthase [Firmicutes bacterium]|nr:cobyric acid synthase [Bacillota bacterium]